MQSFAPLPPSTRALVRRNTHPGLMLDKYAPSWTSDGAPPKFSEDVQRPTLMGREEKGVVELTADPPLSAADFQALRDRHRTLTTKGRIASVFACTSTGPLTLHLARASALENAGICLHPLYGFVYLPGTALKGMARAYAETVWLAEQADQKAAWRSIEDVFGWAPTPERREDHENHDSKEIREHAGSVVFHDAWPTTWPRLIMDIVNNHHQEYYSASAHDNTHAPGDWENPAPVYFLAVPAGATFEFAIGKRTDDVPDELLQNAKQWLIGALCHLGAGAKTAAGYGSFKPEAEAAPAPALDRRVRAVFETTLELVTPAFLAGAIQKAEDCDLRPATLRGLLRWWWRTMHAGFADVKTLRSLEAAIWGDTQAGGAVRVCVESLKRVTPKPYSKRDHANMNPAEKTSQYGIPGCQASKTTQGLWYASYGMDERGKTRWYVEPGARWLVRIAARETNSIGANHVLEQAKAALWLLCQYGAVGSKSRKGFGCIRAEGLNDWDPATCGQIAAELRTAARLPSAYQERWAESPALPQAMFAKEVPFAWQDPWQVLDQIGFAYQTFAKKYKHRLEKKMLGLPHRVGPPVSGTFSPTGPMKKRLDEARRERREDSVRHASPIHIHVGRAHDGRYLVSALAFPAAYLPNVNASRAFLQEFLEFFEGDLQRRAALPPPPRAGGAGRAQRPASRAQQKREPAPSEPSTRLATIAPDQLKQHLAEVKTPQAIMKVVGQQGAGIYTAQRLRLANVAAGYQGDGGYRITAAPPGLPEGTIVLTEEQHREGRFIRTLGRLPPPPSPPRSTGPRRR